MYAAEAHEEVDGPEDEEPYIPLVCGLAITSRPAPSTLSSLQAQSVLLGNVAQCDALQEGRLVNTTPTSATERSPIEVRTGRVPLTNLRLTEELRAAYDPAVIDNVEDQVRLIDEGAELAAEARAKLTDRKASQAKGKHWLDSLVVGDMVMVNSKTISTPAKKAGLVNRKTEPRWYGSYRVIAYVAYRTVQLQLPAKSKVWPGGRHDSSGEPTGASNIILLREIGPHLVRRWEG